MKGSFVDPRNSCKAFTREAVSIKNSLDEIKSASSQCMGILYLITKWFRFAKLRIFLVKSICQKKAELSQFELVMSQTHTFRQSDWPRKSRASQERPLTF